jgi:D-alanine-D-alanine ligase
LQFVFCNLPSFIGIPVHVSILHNAVPHDASAADRDVLVQADVVRAALASLGHTWTTIACTLDLDNARQELLAARPDVIFNLVESLGGSDWLMLAATSLLDTLGIPYTGSPTESILLTTHKLLAKDRLRQAGLPTPDWAAPSRNATRPAATLRPPYLIKTVREHASFGLDEDSVILQDDPIALPDRLHKRIDQLGCPCFAEAYVDGREFNLSVLAGPDGPQVLPPAEIDFSSFPAHKPRVVGQRAKWEEESFEFVNTVRRFDFPPADSPLLDRLTRIARDSWDVFGLHGWARVDFRVDPAGNPWILEINANPCLSPDAGFAAAVDRAGLTFAAAVARILADALPSSRV